MNRVVHKLQPTIPVIPQLKRVAAYARVSNDKESMVESLVAQVGYYSAHIQRNPQWIYVGVYADVDTPYGQNPKVSWSIISEQLSAPTGKYNS